MPFELLQGGKQEQEPSQEKLKEELLDLRNQYACGIDLKPRWMVYGEDPEGGKGVIYWIKPEEDSQLIAKRMANLVTDLGGFAVAEKTEWHPDILESKDIPVDQNDEHLDYILRDM